MAKLTANTYVADNGWTGRSFVLTHAPVTEAEVHLELDPNYMRKEPTPVAIKEVACEGGKVTITSEAFLYGNGWTLTVGADRYTRTDVDDEQVQGLDEFAAKKDGDVLYRLYSPKSKQPRPMILFLHGGGESGFDNLKQMVGTIGALHLAEKYPDFYIMAPQAPALHDFSMMVGRATTQTFANSDMPGKHGWHREYLAAVCDIIRGMIDEGKVDMNRVYVTGMSMGGGGTLRAMSVGAGLFAAAAPICPTMTPETFDILRSLVDAKIWISTAYVDHTIYRHKYIVDGIMALRDAGNQDAHLTLYSPEELEAYGIATDPELPLQAKFGANHASWILTYHNEHGILSWLTEQTL